MMGSPKREGYKGISSKGEATWSQTKGQCGSNTDPQPSVYCCQPATLLVCVVSPLVFSEIGQHEHTQTFMIVLWLVNYDETAPHILPLSPSFHINWFFKGRTTSVTT